MRRLLALPLIASALAFVPPASAHDVPCYGVHAGETAVGACAGIICGPDLCGPRVVVHGQCEGVNGPLVLFAALCAVYDNYRPLG